MTSMDREFELDLVARLRAGDSDAFDLVYGAFNARLFNFLTEFSHSALVPGASDASH